MSTELGVLSSRYSGPTEQALGTDIVERCTAFGSKNVAQLEPRYQEIARLGRMYSISTAGGTAKAPVASVGTTTAAFALFNGNAATTRYQIVLIEVAVFIVSGTPALGGSVMMGMSPTVQAAAVSGYSGVVGPKSLSGSTSRTSQAVIGGAITLAGAPVWTQIGNIQAIAAGDVGHGGTYNVDGRVIIPPQFACGFTVMAAAGTTPLYGWAFTFAEYQTDPQ